MGHGLSRQPIHHVEVDASNARSAQTPHRLLHLLYRLNAAHLALNLVIRVLQAERASVEAGFLQRPHHVLGQGARIEFHGEFGAKRERKQPL